MQTKFAFLLIMSTHRVLVMLTNANVACMKTLLKVLQVLLSCAHGEGGF